MELTFYTDYSLRVLMHLGSHHFRLSMISEIADDYGKLTPWSEATAPLCTKR